MRLPDLKQLKEQSVLWVVPAYVAAYFLDSRVNSFFFPWLIDLATSEDLFAIHAGYCLGFTLLSAAATSLLAIYYYILKFLDLNFTKGLLSPVIAFALLAVGLLGLEPVVTKAENSSLNPLWHMGAFAQGFYTLHFWGDIES